MPYNTPLPVPAPRSTGVRSGAAAPIAGVAVFPLLGGMLALAGMGVGEILALIGGCGLIGAATVAAVSGRLTGALAAAAVRAAQDQRP
ncbi:hypothetical protein [Streptomyces sp. NRRL F-5193]|uniref:hypothetical protein n=1 Tax=Streptomyces sp. NRRL F-5193 TaxID=1463860 RepID=UPI0007C6AB54|nr:hypothetical protein [Streptomyces sp. NRRL F-5193]